MCVHKYGANISYYDSYSRLYSVLRYAFKHFKSCLVAWYFEIKSYLECAFATFYTGKALFKIIDIVSCIRQPP